MMRILFLILTIGLMFHTSVSQAADLQQLQQQVSALQQELRTIRLLINRAKDGTTFFRATQDKQELTGGNEVNSVHRDQHTEVGRSQTERIKGGQSLFVGGNQRTSVGRSQTEEIGTQQSLFVGTNQSTRVGKDSTLQVGDNLTENVATNRTMASGKQMIMTAGDQLILKSGKSSIVLKKNGEIDIKGKNIFIKGSGPVTIKGSKVTTN